jgi:hypothetical protein
VSGATEGYEVVLVDVYFDYRRTETLEAASLDGAVDQALHLASEENLHVDQVSSPDGEVACFGTPEYEVVEATALIRYGREYVEDTVASLTFQMALDLMELLHPAGEVVALRAQSFLSWMSDSDGSGAVPPGWRLHRR